MSKREAVITWEQAKAARFLSVRKGVYGGHAGRRLRVLEVDEGRGEILLNARNARHSTFRLWQAPLGYRIHELQLPRSQKEDVMP